MPVRTFPLASYSVLEALRVGGLTQSYLTRCVATHGHERAVLKQLLPSFSDDPSLTERWLHKAEQNAAVSHPGCARVLDWGRCNGEAYLAVEYVEGVGLKHILRALRGAGERLPLSVAVYVARSALDALAHGHDLLPPLPHLDVSPYSLIVKPAGALSLTEFGMWDALGPADVARLRFDRGRVNYVSPEQAKSQPAGARSDVFSLGMVLHEMLVGHLPFAGATQLVVAMAIAENKRKPLRELAPSLPQDLCEVVEHLLAHKPEERFQTARAALNALTAVGPVDPSAPVLLAEIAARTAHAGKSSAPPTPEKPPLPVQPAPSAPSPRGWASPAPLPRAEDERRTEQWDLSAMRVAVPASVTPPASVAPPSMTPPGASGRSPGPVPPPLLLDAHVGFGAAAPPDSAHPLRSSPVPPAMLPVSAPVLAVPAPVLAAPAPSPDGASSPVQPPPASAKPSTPVGVVAPATAPSPLATSDGKPGYLSASTPPDAAPALAMPRTGDGGWQEPSKTLFQMKSYAKGATARGTSKTPLWLAVVLATIFGFAAVAGGYLALRLMQ